MSSSTANNTSKQHVITVGIIGSCKQSYSKDWVCQQIICNQLSNGIKHNGDGQSLHDPFEWIRSFQSAQAKDECSQKSMITMYDDNESNTIYFNLKSHHNLNELNKLLTLLCSTKSQYEYHKILQQTEYIYIKSLIFIFLSCHHILLFQETPRFNPQWLSIFHFLQSIKLKLILPMIDILIPVFNHTLTQIDEEEKQEKDSKKSGANIKQRIMDFLSSSNLPPFIVPILTFLYPPPNTFGYILLDQQRSKMFANDHHKNTLSILENAVLRKFTNRLQQQIVVLLRRCHIVFPYFQTEGSLADKMLKKELFECIESLKKNGFDTQCYLDEAIYSTHSRWIEADDMMHRNALSLFSLLPNKFVQMYASDDLLQFISFLFEYHKNIYHDQHHRSDGYSKNAIYEKLQAINDTIKQWLNGQNVSKNGQKSSEHMAFSDRIINKVAKEQKQKESNDQKAKNMPLRIHFYVSSKTVYDALFKSHNEIIQNHANVNIINAYLRIFNLFNFDSQSTKMSKKEQQKMPYYKLSTMEQNYDKLHINLDIDRLSRYSSLLCRRAYKSARNCYLNELPEMYTFGTHREHVKAAMKLYRQQTVGPLQEWYARQLFVELNEMWQTNGRQKCAAISLTGRACCRPIHDGKCINLDAVSKNKSAEFAEDRYKKFGQDPNGHFSGFSSSHACNCGRSMSKREDPFDLVSANITFFEHKCCKRVLWKYQLYFDAMHNETNNDLSSMHMDDEQQKNVKSEKPNYYKSGFYLCNHGGAELYHKQTGITQQGFDRYNNFLLRWDIPICSSVYAFHQQLRAKNSRYRNDNYYNNAKKQRYREAVSANAKDSKDENLGNWIHKLRKTVTLSSKHPNSNAYFPCFVGLEFECYRGHRCILDYKETIYQSQFDDNYNPQNAENRRFIDSEFPTQNIPLRVPCKQCSHSRGHGHGKHHDQSIVNAQLQRAFIVTPPSPIAITAKPVIVCNTMPDAVFEFDTCVVLPPSSFLVMRFPYIYFHDGRGLPPDKLVLCKGMLSVQHNVNVLEGSSMMAMTPKKDKRSVSNKRSNGNNKKSVKNKRIVIKRHRVIKDAEEENDDKT